MVVKIEKFNNLDFLLVDMVVGCGSGQSLEEIQDFIDASLEEFVREHRGELVAALDSDYEETPDVPSYHSYYDTELVHQIRSKMEQAGYGDKDIEEMISWGNGLFYNSILPSARSI